MEKVLVLVILLAIQISANTCGGNCPSNTCPQCLCGSVYEYGNATYWCSKHTWNQSCCNCIIQHESAGNRNAMNFNVDSSYDVGLWQINTINWSYCGNGKAPCNVQENFECAKLVYGWGGNTWTFWATASMCGCQNSA